MNPPRSWEAGPRKGETMRTLGAFLIAFGIIAICYGSIDYTRQKTVIDAGPIQATIDQKHHIPLSPIAGGAALVLGIILVTRRSRMA